MTAQPGPGSSSVSRSHEKRKGTHSGAQGWAAQGPVARVSWSTCPTADWTHCHSPWAVWLHLILEMCYRCLYPD